MQAEQRLQDLQEAQQKLVDCLAHKAGWLMFFYADAATAWSPCGYASPTAKSLSRLSPGSLACLAANSLRPYTIPPIKSLNDHLIVVEGEFNALQLQSLTVRYEEATGQPLRLSACLCGRWRPGGRYRDHQAGRPASGDRVRPRHQSGWLRAGQARPDRHAGGGLHHALTWGDKSDLDSYICDFDQDHAAAWEGVKALIAERQPYGRTYSNTGEEFFNDPVNSKAEVFVPKLLGDALMARETYRYTASQLWIYQHGVYLPSGEARLRADAQTLLGKERREERLNEALHYVEVATQREEAGEPDCQYINVKNGRLAWKTGELHPHTSAVFTPVQLPTLYDAGASCPTFEHYLSTTFEPDDIPLIEEILGWCLVPDRRFEQAVMLTGEGENGKSVFLDLVGYLLGEDNVSNVALQDLEENRFRAAELYGKLANVFADLDARGLQSSSMFKTLTTGDWITAERKHAQPFRFRCYAKLLFSANRIPPNRDKTHAFYRRWLIIPFTRTFNGEGTNPQPDKQLREKLKDELPGILNRALQGLARLTLNEAFTQPPSVTEAKKAFMRRNDNLRVFAEECLLANPIGTIPKQEFADVYKRWCESYGDRPVAHNLLKEALKQIFPMLDEWREDKSKPRCWMGFEWSDDAASYKPATLIV